MKRLWKVVSFVMAIIVLLASVEASALAGSGKNPDKGKNNAKQEQKKEEQARKKEERQAQKQDKGNNGKSEQAKNKEKNANWRGGNACRRIDEALLTDRLAAMAECDAKTRLQALLEAYNAAGKAVAYAAGISFAEKKALTDAKVAAARALLEAMAEAGVSTDDVNAPVEETVAGADDNGETTLDIAALGEAIALIADETTRASLTALMDAYAGATDENRAAAADALVAALTVAGIVQAQES